MDYSSISRRGFLRTSAAAAAVAVSMGAGRVRAAAGGSALR